MNNAAICATMYTGTVNQTRKGEMYGDSVQKRQCGQYR